MTDLEMEIAKLIGEFFLKESDGHYEKAELLAFRSHISDISVVGLNPLKIQIVTGRPGMLIGHRGERIGRMTGFLKQEFPSIEILTKEDRQCLYDFIVPKPEIEEPDWEDDIDIPDYKDFDEYEDEKYNPQ